MENTILFGNGINMLNLDNVSWTELLNTLKESRMFENNNLPNTKEAKKYFWQIHGEIRKPATIMLGLDHYCGEIGKIDNNLKGSYRFTEDKKTIVEESL